jgi:hypothetical protein
MKRIFASIKSVDKPMLLKIVIELNLFGYPHPHQMIPLNRLKRRLDDTFNRVGGLFFGSHLSIQPLF